MNQQVEIIFRNAERSDAVESAVRERAEGLARLHDRLQHCRVVIEMTHRRMPKGREYRARIDLKLPGKNLVVGRASAAAQSHPDVYVAIRHAFDAAQRRLQDFSRRRRGDVKSHEAPPHGQVARLFPAEGYGFIRMSDGQEVYFHRNAVVNEGFDRLAVGAEVRVSVHDGESDKGSQAGTVKPLGRHHIVAAAKRA
ncbi:MAG: HPF/RaiA family ribosome-associated protein [Alphaproteobacteria bacterium]|nr:HPF/RaiA family ribosome-associated protein [Alphaproteobacteria bacterium]